jgi:hypothetical protein
MATTAKALLSSPSTLKAFSDIKKVDTINLQAKIKKAAQAAAKGVEEKVVFVNKNMFSSSSMTKAVQELGKLLGDDNDDFLLIEDILDEDLIDDTAISPVSDTENSQFERLRKVPLGTFWNSQRSRKGSKRNLQRAIKGTFDNKILDSTLLETLPTKKRRKSVSVFSPMLVAVDSREGVHTFQVDDIPSYLIPPPLNLN